MNARIVLNFIIFTIPYKCITRTFIYLNRIYLKFLGIKVGKDCRIMGVNYIRKSIKGEISIGDNFVLTSGRASNPLSSNKRGCLYVEDDAKLFIGNNVGISSSVIWAAKSVYIGDNVKIGANSVIMDTDAHSLDYLYRRESYKDQQYKVSKPIVIANDVLVGTGCIILKGVTIGARSIIGSGSIVTKDIPSDCVAAGNPCKVLKFING